MEVSVYDAGHIPVIGILTMHDDEGRPFRGNHNNFVDLIRAGYEKGAFVYVLTVQDLRVGSRRVRGYAYDFAKKSWNVQWMPIPQVIYNRIPYRVDEMLPEVQQTIHSCLKHSRIHLFNPSFFNKWSLFEWLSASNTTKKIIPDTQLLTSSQELDKLLRQHPFVYLKPVLGKAGKGIMRVEKALLKSKLKEYRLTVQDGKKSVVWRCPGFDELWRKINEYTEKEQYIVQQGISLANVNRRPFDLRVLVQKNNKGEWDLTGVGARVAGRLSITTHVPRGGSIDDAEKLLSVKFGESAAKKIMVGVKKTALSIARQIEKGSSHVLGEMSMDLGVDITGNTWFFEANSKPMKFDEPHIRKKSLERIIEYSMYLIKSRNK